MNFYPIYELPDHHVNGILAKSQLVPLIRARQSCKWLNEVISKKRYTASSAKRIDGIVIVQSGAIIVRTKINQEEDFKDRERIHGVHFDQLVISTIDPWITNQERWTVHDQSLFNQTDEGIREKLLDTLQRVSCDFLVLQEVLFPGDIHLISATCRRFKRLKLVCTGRTTIEFEHFSSFPFNRLTSLTLSTSEATLIPGNLIEALRRITSVSLDFSMQSAHSMDNLRSIMSHCIWSIYCDYLSGDPIGLNTLSMFYQTADIEDIYDWKSYREMPKLFPFKTIWDGRKHKTVDEDDLGGDSILVYSREDNFTMLIKLTVLRIEGSSTCHVGINLRVIPAGLDHFVEKISTMLLGKSDGLHRRVVDSSSLHESMDDSPEEKWSGILHNFIENCHQNNRICLLKRIQDDMISIAKMLREVVTKNTLVSLEEEADRLMIQADLSQYRAS